MTSRLFTLGEVLAVFMVDDELPLGEATRFRRIVAGSESNVAAGFVRLGHRATLVTSVGRDGLGDAVESSLRSWGIDSWVKRVDRPTGSLVRERAGSEPFQVVHLRAGSAALEISAADVDAAWPSDADVVFVTGITGVRSAGAHDAACRTVDRARESGALVVVDPNLRLRLAPVEAFEEALRPFRGRVDVAIGDARELGVLAGTAPGQAPGALLAAGARLVVVKLGADGAWATDGTTEVRVPSPAIRVVDTVGAGDALAAGMIAAVVEGMGVRAGLELGSALAAAVVATPGDVEGFPRSRPGVRAAEGGAGR